MRLHVKIAIAVSACLILHGPVSAQFFGAIGSLDIGPGGTQTFDWQINDAGPSPTYPNAPGVAGGGTGNQQSGWDLTASERIRNPMTGITSNGNVVWSATNTAGNQFDFQLETLLGPTTPVGTITDGPMSDFDPTQLALCLAVRRVAGDLHRADRHGDVNGGHVDRREHVREFNQQLAGTAGHVFDHV